MNPEMGRILSLIMLSCFFYPFPVLGEIPIGSSDNRKTLANGKVKNDNPNQLTTKPTEPKALGGVPFKKKRKKPFNPIAQPEENPGAGTPEGLAGGIDGKKEEGSRSGGENNKNEYFLKDLGVSTTATGGPKMVLQIMHYELDNDSFGPNFSFPLILKASAFLKSELNKENVEDAVLDIDGGTGNLSIGVKWPNSSDGNFLFFASMGAKYIEGFIGPNKESSFFPVAQVYFMPSFWFGMKEKGGGTSKGEAGRLTFEIPIVYNYTKNHIYDQVFGANVGAGVFHIEGILKISTSESTQFSFGSTIYSNSDEISSRVFLTGTIIH